MTWLQQLLRVAICAVVPLTASTAVAVDIWITTGDKSQLLSQKSDILFQPGAGSGGTPVSVSSEITFQTIDGFGAAMTDASAWLFQNKLNTAQRDKLMRQIFSPETGIGISYVRVPMGSSDFTASGFYTYNDNPSGGSDELQQQFSIAHDQAYITPRLRQAMQLNPNLKLMATPWSAPAWMKSNNSLEGGSLLAQWESSYARYLAKFIQAYDDEGLPIDTITIQNEPLHTSNYPTMSMSATQQASFIKNHLGPRFAAEGILSKVLVYDHNWDNTSYPVQILNDPIARQFVAGTAFHAYAGDVSAQSTVHDAHPDKDIYFTEISGGEWATNFADNLVWTFQNVLIGGTRNWAKTALLWNLALNQHFGPHQGGCSNCRGVVTINDATGAVTFNEEFYALGQVTKAVQINAVRIDSTTTAAVNTVAFLNPDGSQALVALNPTASPITIRVLENGNYFKYEIPSKSVVTFLWDDHGADFDNGGFDDGGFQHGGGSLDAWTPFGQTNGNVSTVTGPVLNGDRSLKLQGQFTGNENVSGVSQAITVSAGQQVQATMSAMVKSTDSIADTKNVAELKIEFYSEFGGAHGGVRFLGESYKILADRDFQNDIWSELQLTGIAPPGAAEARLVLQFRQPNDQQGAVYIDRVSFSISDQLSMHGDYNKDGVVNAADYVVWRKTDDAPDGFNTWRANFGRTTGGGSMSNPTVPEPAAALLSLLGTAIGYWRTMPTCLDHPKTH